jgi:hypothetical protein
MSIIVGSRVSFTYTEKNLSGEVVSLTKNGRFVILADSLFKNDGSKRKVVVGEKTITVLEAVA